MYDMVGDDISNFAGENISNSIPYARLNTHTVDARYKDDDGPLPLNFKTYTEPKNSMLPCLLQTNQPVAERWHFCLFFASITLLWLAFRMAERVQESDLQTFSFSIPRGSAFELVRERWEHVCPPQNVVLDRFQRGKEVPLPKTWSIHPKYYGDMGMHSCSEWTQLIAAIKDGKRVWDDTRQGQGATETSKNDLHSTDRPSYFLPKGCHIPYLGAIEACNVLNAYSRVLFLGDSLGRHTAQGLGMLLSDDFALGAYSRGVGKNAQIMNDCRCDGQFSEHVKCRANDSSILMPNDPRDYGLCSHLHNETFSLLWAPIGVPNRTEIHPLWDALCTDDHRPMLVILNAGAHFRADPDAVMHKFIDVVLKKLQAASESCLENNFDFKIIWVGFNAQSRSLDSFFPHQSREKAIIFNDIVDKYASSKYGMIPVSFFNLTLDAPSNDGYHYLSDVNLFKANAILQLARLLV